MHAFEEVEVRADELRKGDRAHTGWAWNKAWRLIQDVKPEDARFVRLYFDVGRHRTEALVARDSLVKVRRAADVL